MDKKFDINIIGVKDVRDDKETLHKYLDEIAQKSLYGPLCETCGKIITGPGIEVDKTIYYGNSDKEEIIPIFSLYCSTECEYLGELTEWNHRIMGNLETIVNHLIKMHKFNPKILEKALNSKIGKEILSRYYL
jgi:hypothetical protein